MNTIKEVARQAGVSTTTVSHVLNNTRFVSNEVRSRVMEAMRELGYKPNALARSLRSGKTNTIGLIVPDSANPFFAELARAVDAEAIVSGFNVILCNTEDDPLKEQIYLDLLGRRRVDGVILLSEAVQIDTLRALQVQGIHLVGGVHELEGIHMDTVLSDGRQGGYLATSYLLSLGHRRIGCIVGPAGRTSSAERLAGYAQAMEESGTEVDPKLISSANYHPDAAYEIALKWLIGENPPSAIFASNDLMAMGALRAAAEAGRVVPRDLSLVGFDDIELASYTVPALTTIAQHQQKLAKVAINMLLERIHGSKAEIRREVLDTRLVVRGTCAPLTK